MSDPFRPNFKSGEGSPEPPRSTVSDRLEQFERRQRQLWRVTYSLLGLLTVAYVFVSWDAIRIFADRYEVLLVGLVVLVALFIAYSWKRNQEMAELRGLVRGIEKRDATPPSDRQLDQLFSVIERSQQGYRDLIDSFDDVLVSITLEGEVRAANRSFAELVGGTFQQIIGHPLGEFLEDAGGEGPKSDPRQHAALSRPEALDWSGAGSVEGPPHRPLLRLRDARHAARRARSWHDDSRVVTSPLPAATKRDSPNSSKRCRKASTSSLPKTKFSMSIRRWFESSATIRNQELLARKVSDVFPDESLRNVIQPGS